MDERKIIKLYDNTKIIYPLKNEDGSVCWRNVFHGWQTTLLVVALICFVVWAYKHDINQCKEVIETPLKFCGDYCSSLFK